MKAETEFILQCNSNSFIELVLFSRKAKPVEALLNKPLLFCLTPDYLEVGKRFLEDIRWTGKAENFRLGILLDNEEQILNFSGVQLQDYIIIEVQQNNEEGDLPVAELIAEEVNQVIAEIPAVIETSETDLQTEVTVWDLMEEMSRLNNELINTKRELIRKNMELERLQVQLKKR